jgi:hypothetical protein
VRFDECKIYRNFKLQTQDKSWSEILGNVKVFPELPRIAVVTVFRLTMRCGSLATFLAVRNVAPTRIPSVIMIWYLLVCCALGRLSDIQ